jgi:hypothetical protein
MWIGFAHIFQIVDLRFCHDRLMIIDAFKAIKRRRLLFAPPHSTPLSVCWWLSRCWRAPHNFGQNCRGRSEVLGLTLRNFLAPFQRLPDDFVFVRAGELLQKSLATFLINERSEPTALRTAPGVQLDRKVAVINAALKRWRIPQLLRVTDTTLPSASEQASGVWEKGWYARSLHHSRSRYRLFCRALAQRSWL